MRLARLVFAAAFLASAPARATITIHANSNPLILATGDSIMARGVLQPVGGLLDQLQTGLGTGVAAVAQGGNVAAVAQGGNVTPAAVGYRFINTGINGDTIEGVAAGIQSRVLTYHPDIVIFNLGVNNIHGVLGTEETNYNNMVSAVVTALPSVQVGMMSILCFGENWSAGTPPTWANGSTDTFMVGFNSYLGTTLTTTYSANNATLLDDNTPLLTTWEPVHNAPAPGAAQAFTGDGVHPINPGSAVQIGTWIRTGFSIVP
jgi:lysophospholipase L1-like esterase